MDENEGIEAMDSMEETLALMGIGESAYYLLVGAQSGGADTEDSLAILTSWFMAALLTNQPNPTEDEESNDSDSDEQG